VFDEKLASALNFTEEELAANRDGYMTKEQRRRFRSEGRGNIAQLSVLAILCAFLALCFMMALPITEFDYLIRNGLFVIFGLVIVFCVYNAFADWILRKADLRKGAVISIEGNIQFRLNLNNVRELTIRGETLHFRQDALSAFQEGERYRLYMPPYTKQVLSAELVGVKRDV
jgi:hypothetical protein